MSTLMGRGALILWLDVAPGLDRETDAWYVDEHLPERIDIGGYQRARRFVALEGAPSYLTLFETYTPAALASEGYLRLVKCISEQSRRIRRNFSNVVRNAFAVRQSRGRGIGGTMASLRLKVRAGAKREAAVAKIDAEVRHLIRRHGIVGVHWLEAAPEVRARMDAVREVGQGDGRADFALLIEATRPAEIAALRRDALSPGVLARMGWDEQAYGVYSLMYEVSPMVDGVDCKLGDRV